MATETQVNAMAGHLTKIHKIDQAEATRTCAELALIYEETAPRPKSARYIRQRSMRRGQS